MRKLRKTLLVVPFLLFAFFVFGTTVNVSAKANANISVCEYSNGVITYSVSDVSCNATYGVYVLGGKVTGSKTVEQIKEWTFYTGVQNAAETENSVKVNLELGNYTLLIVSDTLTDADVIDFDSGSESFAVKTFVSDGSVEEPNCFIHYILLGVLSVFIVLGLINVALSRKKYFNTFAITVYSIFVVATVVLGLTSLQCIYCVLCMVLNIIVCAGFSIDAIIRDKKEEEENK